MNNYIYINFNDLSEKAQEEIKDIAREEIEKETSKEEAEDLNMDYEDLINERIDNKLLSMNNQGRFVFNI